MRSFRLHRLLLCSLFAALLCILSPLALPVGSVPVSLGLFGVLLCALILPPLYAWLSVGVFLLLGLCGMPVFSFGMGGLPVLLGPTGGYLWAYLFAAPAVSLLAPRIKAFPAALAGILLCYLCGTLQFVLLTHTPPRAALWITVLPFLPFDVIKIMLAAYLAHKLKPLTGRLFFRST